MDQATAKYSLRTKLCGAFKVLRPIGVNCPDLLEELRQDYFDGPQFLAIDLNELAKVNLPLIRAIHEFRRDFAPKGGRVVLINPSRRLRPLLQLLTKDDFFPFVTEESQLEGNPEEVEARVNLFVRNLAEVRQKLFSDPICRYVTEDRRWLCPYCGGIQDEIKVVSFRNIPGVVLERVLGHLHLDCPNYAEKKEPWTDQVLENVLDNANKALRTVEGEDSSPETKIRRLEHRVKRVENVERYLQSAVERQRRLLPSMAPAPGFADVSIIYRPAGDIGGDFYDFVELEGDRLGVIIGSVSGRGLQAGVLMGMAKKVIQLRVKETGDPYRALVCANEDFYSDLGGKSHISVFIGILDPAKTVLTCARAGHAPPILYNPERDARFETINPQGPVLGITEPEKYEPELERSIVQLLPGDHLLLYTRGLDAAKSASGDEFGLERIVALFEQGGGAEADTLLANLAGAVEAFRDEQRQEDDLTAILVRMK